MACLTFNKLSLLARFYRYYVTLLNGIHTNGSNYLAADGHVKWLRATAISPGKDALQSTDPENDSGEHATGTSYMNVNNSNSGSATMTFSKI